MRYIVTGGAGFIGTNLVKRLKADDENNQILIIDNFITGSRNNITESAGVQLEEGDIENFWYKHPDKFHRIINLACPASPVAYQNAPLQTISASTTGVLNMLNAAVFNGARFLHTSTSEIYGDPKVHPQPENYWGHVNCYGPRSCYDEGKRLAETLIYEYQRRGKDNSVDARIVRIFNTYGPYMAKDDGRVVSNFICQALKNEPMTIYGDGSQTRSFCYVDDLIDIMLTILESQCVYERPLNIGNPSEFTVLELAETVKQVTNSKSEIVFKPIPLDDPKQRRPDISKVKNLFNWEPKVELREGLEKTAAYFATQI